MEHSYALDSPLSCEMHIESCLKALKANTKDAYNMQLFMC